MMEVAQVRRSLLSLYRRTLRQAELLTTKEADIHIPALRQFYRSNWATLDMEGELGEIALADFRKGAESRLSFIEMKTPRRQGNMTAYRSKVFDKKSGRVVDGYADMDDKARHTQFTGSNVDPVALKRHWKLFERQVKAGL
eukprot:Clim_evm41s128 gene=Clim_evmTU41s128